MLYFKTYPHYSDTNTMRITENEKKRIQQSILAVDPATKIYLFGSRVDDNAKGGDIDLLLISKKIKLLDKLSILAQLHQKLGDQKIDLAIFPDFSQPFARIAREDAIPL